MYIYPTINPNGPRNYHWAARARRSSLYPSRTQVTRRTPIQEKHSLSRQNNKPLSLSFSLSWVSSCSSRAGNRHYIPGTRTHRRASRNERALRLSRGIASPITEKCTNCLLKTSLRVCACILALAHSRERQRRVCRYTHCITRMNQRARVAWINRRRGRAACGLTGVELRALRWSAEHDRKCVCFSVFRERRERGTDLVLLCAGGRGH